MAAYTAELRRINNYKDYSYRRVDYLQMYIQRLSHLDIDGIKVFWKRLVWITGRV
jgi:hypothetical protein